MLDVVGVLVTVKWMITNLCYIWFAVKIETTLYPAVILEVVAISFDKASN
jgi:hypothetical protein